MLPPTVETEIIIKDILKQIANSYGQIVETVQGGT